MQTVIGQKLNQTQRFLADGRRIPVTIIMATDSAVLQVKTPAKDQYTAVQLGFGTQKKAGRTVLGHIKKAQLKKAPSVIKEVRLDGVSEEELPKIGDSIAAVDVLKPGDIVDVTGMSKGKGFAGGVKRYHFKGGPRTHGQSDRERAPGSLGQTTTPGRVYRGKRMAGNMGNEQVTLHNLEIVEVTKTPLGTQILVRGLVPGVNKGIVVITKTGEKKKFVELYQDPDLVKPEEPVVEEPIVKETSAAEAAPTEEAKVVESAVPGEAAKNETPEESASTPEDPKVEEEGK